MAFLTPKNARRIGVKNLPPKNVIASNYPNIIFVILAKAIVGNPTQVQICVVSMGKTYVCKVNVAYYFLIFF
jgi:hypothetical protein